MMLPEQFPLTALTVSLQVTAQVLKPKAPTDMERKAATVTEPKEPAKTGSAE
jgi:hypothetical protein